MITRQVSTGCVRRRRRLRLKCESPQRKSWKRSVGRSRSSGSGKGDGHRRAEFLDLPGEPRDLVLTAVAAGDPVGTEVSVGDLDLPLVPVDTMCQ